MHVISRLTNAARDAWNNTPRVAQVLISGVGLVAVICLLLDAPTSLGSVGLAVYMARFTVFLVGSIIIGLNFAVKLYELLVGDIAKHKRAREDIQNSQNLQVITHSYSNSTHDSRSKRHANKFSHAKKYLSAVVVLLIALLVGAASVYELSKAAQDYATGPVSGYALVVDTQRHVGRRHRNIEITFIANLKDSQDRKITVNPPFTADKGHLSKVRSSIGLLDASVWDEFTIPEGSTTKPMYITVYPHSGVLISWRVV